ncbi:30S ribosomal protein S6 [Planctomycetales bacterium]|nr:30S ribosomal protein S6 [Planctomycetales bacterium]
MAKNVYEGLFIFDSDLYAKGPEDISSQIAGVISQLGGEVLISRLWDERKLAYPIKGHRRGTYWLAYFRCEPPLVKDITRQFQLNDSILRFLILSVDARLVDTLVEYARTGYVRESDAPASAAPVEVKLPVSEIPVIGEEASA